MRRTVEGHALCAVAPSPPVIPAPNPNPPLQAFGSRHVPPEVVLHEVGHALGFWHVDDRQSTMFPITAGGSRAAELSDRERHHSAIAYKRPNGSSDVDIDPAEPDEAHPLGRARGGGGRQIAN